MRRSAAIVMVGRALGLAAAFASSWAIARAFGDGPVADAFYAAYAIPHAFLIVAGSVLPSAFIPVHAGMATKSGPAEAWRFTIACVNAATLALIVLVVVGLAIAPWLARASAPGFDARSTRLVAMQLAALLPIVAIGGIAYVAKGILHARQVFFSPALDTFASNVAILAAVLLFAKGWSGWALVAGFLAGNVLRLAVMAPDFVRTAPGTWSASVRHPGLSALGVLLVPLGVTALLSAGNVVLTRALATKIGPGAVSHLAYADRLVSVPVDLIASSIGAALLPAAAAAFAEGRRRDFADGLERAISGTLAILVPAGVGLWALSDLVVRLVYRHGAFDYDASEATARVLRYFTPMLPGAALLVAAQGFYAMGRGKLVLAAGAVVTLANVPLCLWLRGPLEEAGLGLALGLSNVLGLAIAVGLVRWSVPEFPLRRLLVRLLWTAVAAGAMGAAVAFGKRMLIPMRPLAEFVQLLGLAVLGTGLYGALRFFPRRGRLIW